LAISELAPEASRETSYKANGPGETPRSGSASTRTPEAEAPLAVQASLFVSAGARIGNLAAQPLTIVAPLLWLCPR